MSAIDTTNFSNGLTTKNVYTENIQGSNSNSLRITTLGVAEVSINSASNTINCNSSKLTGVAEPTVSTDAATQNYVNNKAPLTTKGDILSFSTIPSRIGVGTNGQVLTADSAQGNGLQWTTLSTSSNDLSDIIITTRVANQILSVNTGNTNWVNKTISNGTNIILTPTDTTLTIETTASLTVNNNWVIRDTAGDLEFYNGNVLGTLSSIGRFTCLDVVRTNNSSCYGGTFNSTNVDLVISTVDTWQTITGGILFGVDTQNVSNFVIEPANAFKVTYYNSDSTLVPTRKFHITVIFTTYHTGFVEVNYRLIANGLPLSQSTTSPTASIKSIVSLNGISSLENSQEIEVQVKKVSGTELSHYITQSSISVVMV